MHVLLALVALTGSAPNAALLVPQSLLAPATAVVELDTSTLISGATRLPDGQLLGERYHELSLNLRARLGLHRFITAEVLVPLVSNAGLDDQGLGVTRFGDPTLGLLAGGRVGPITVAPTAELTFPSSKKLVLHVRDRPLGLSDHGAVVSHGGVTAVLGAMAAYDAAWPNSTLQLSGRAYYRVRSNQASDGAGFDLRARVGSWRRPGAGKDQPWVHLGAHLGGLFAFGGLERAFLSPSRLADGASWLDVGASAGLKLAPWLDLTAGLSAPLWVASSAYGLQLHFALSVATAQL